MANHPLFPKNGPGAPSQGIGSSLHQAAAASVAPGGSQVRNNATLSNGMLVGQSVAALSSGPGPNAFEVGVVSYDPDEGIVNVRVKDSPDAEEIDCTVEVEKMTGNGTIQIVLGDSKLSPKIEIKITPRVKPPKFATIEEAEAWMEANS